jgi:hypothetical protein
MGRKLTDIEIRFCLENRIDQRIALGEKFDASPIEGRTEAFWIEEGRGFGAELIIKQIDALMIADSARFANAVVKLLNAYGFAKQFGIPLIYHPGFEFLSDNIVVDEIRIIKGEPSEANVLKSNFFYGKIFRPFFQLTTSRCDLLRKLSPHLDFPLGGQRLRSEKELFIHIRSGDIFKKEITHHLYGQPPFSFYKKVIELEKWELVSLVYEDDSNPVIDRLKAYLKELSVAFETHSGTLKQDIEVLCGAKDLVIGRGNFIYPVLCLSKNIERVFCFENDDRCSWGLQNSNISFVTVTDKLGAFRNDVLKHWKNTPEQNHLLLTYLKENLAFS